MNPLEDTEAWLVDDRWAKAYPLGDSTTIGRDPDNTIILRDTAVSRHHASVVRRGDGYVLQAMGASGTKLNGDPVAAEIALGEGDIVAIAFTTLRFTNRAPTGEMFVIRRDRPTAYDDPDVRTSAPLRATEAVVGLWRKHWHFFVGVVLLVLMLLVLLGW